MLKLQFKDRRRESVWLVDEYFTIGSGKANSLMVEDTSIEETHVEIINNSDQLAIVSKSPKSITKVNNKDISGKTTLKANDIITIGSVELELIDSQSLMQKKNQTIKPAPIWSLYSSASWLEKNNFIINKKTVIGRDPSSDICLALDYLSRQHVCLEPQNGRLFIEDLNSSNGTFVNGNKVQKTELKPGDKIKLDVLTFEVKGPSEKTENDPHKTIIRTANTSPKTTSVDKKRTHTSSSPPTKTAQKSPVKRKRLASEGKQTWISGDNQLKTKPEKSGKKGIVLTVIALTIVACGLAFVLFA